MSFAGPADPMLRQMLAIANGRGIVLIAAVGNAGPKSPPLYPGADAGVIGVTVTDADDKLMPQANRGPQVAVAAPGVEILAAAPDGKYQIKSGTSVAAAHVSGVAALLLATKPKLTPEQVRGNLVRSAHRVPRVAQRNRGRCRRRPCRRKPGRQKAGVCFLDSRPIRLDRFHGRHGLPPR